MPSSSAADRKELQEAVDSRDTERAAAVLARIPRIEGRLAPVAAKLLELALFEDRVDVLRAALEKGAAVHRARAGDAPYLASAQSLTAAKLLLDQGAPLTDFVLYWLGSNRGREDVKRLYSELLGFVVEADLAKVEPMALDAFWSLVESALKKGKDDASMQAREVAAELKKGSASAMVAFQRRFDACVAQLRSAELWALFYLADGGCSDDRFLFEVPSHVIALGRAIFEAAVDDPDTLVPHLHKNRRRFVNRTPIECQHLADSARVAFEMLTGRDDFPRLVGPLPGSTRSLAFDPSDSAWLAARLPRAWKQFGARASE